MWHELRSYLRTRASGRSAGPAARRPGARPPNLLEAAAVHVAACAGDDRARAAAAEEWVSPEALAFGVRELACRAVLALARERGQDPQTVARELLGLPAR
ncbi:hypothetical protein [Streptomyces sp. ODS05-4]|uniref:hypothetical protein n=1 Tax=Streptomyces sp. ODS05-4 TaxID=2944939 RepID=UPI00210AAEE6|nr:hypothetical protein [Streptomyces sp. ODS05-4]